MNRASLAQRAHQREFEYSDGRYVYAMDFGMPELEFDYSIQQGLVRVDVIQQGRPVDEFQLRLPREVTDPEITVNNGMFLIEGWAGEPPESTEDEEEELEEE